MFMAETVVFAIIMVAIGVYITRKPELPIYPTEGYYAGTLMGRRKHVYQSLWFVAAAASLLWRPWLAYSLLVALIMLLPFFLQRSLGPTRRGRH